MAPLLYPSATTATATGSGSQPFHSKGVGVGTTQHSRWGCGKVSLSLPPELGEVPNPYGGPQVELQPELVSTDRDQVLFMRRNSHEGIPSDYFICGWQGAYPQQLPLPPEDFLPRSMGLLYCRKASYLVAHLSVTRNQNTGLITEGTLHFCNYNTSSPKTAVWESVTLPLRNLKNWHNHRVVPFEGTDLMWVDFQHGILRMSFRDGKPSTTFQFVSLPSDLSSISTQYWRGDRPEMFRSVGCCNGKVQLVNLHIPSANTVAVHIWTLDLKCGNWREDYNDVRLICSKLWASYYGKPRGTNLWPNRTPIFPFLREDNNSTILCLTVVEQKNKKAWLLQIDMGTRTSTSTLKGTRTSTLKDVTEYPRWYSPMKQPFLINSSSMGTMILWPL